VSVVMTGAFRALPPALPDAALLDGASPAGAFFRVMLPAAGRGVRAAAGLSAIVSWNGFIFARTLCHAGRLVSVSKTLTLPVLLFDLKNAGAGHADLALVAVLLAAPALLLAMMLRRFFTPGPTGLTGAGRLC
jgi:multiple sugar transport system permease protein